MEKKIDIYIHVLLNKIKLSNKCKDIDNLNDVKIQKERYCPVRFVLSGGFR